MSHSSSNERIICGRFDPIVDLSAASTAETKRYRIWSQRPSQVKRRPFEPIATDGEQVLHNGRTWRPRDFFASLVGTSWNRLMVLTISERDLLLNASVDFDVNVASFETTYPIFGRIKYTSSMASNLRELNKLLGRVEKLGFGGCGLAELVTAEHLYQVERKIRFKNDLDRYFAFSDQGGYQEIFKLKEERPDRVVLALDFNSMYVDGMDGEFVDPGRLRYVDFRGSDLSDEQLASGLYHVILKRPLPGPFLSMHPFKYRKLGRGFYFEMESHHEVEVLLFSNEVAFYKDLFEEIEIVEGICSRPLSRHPLRKKALALYRERKKYENDGSEVMANLCKFRMQTMHSATSRKRYLTRSFQKSSDAASYLARQYMVDLTSHGSTLSNLATLSDGNRFSFGWERGVIQARLVDFSSHDLVLGLSAQVIANSRLKMVRTIMGFLTHPSVELCYANTDSIHLSIHRSELDSFLEQNSDLIADAVGKLRVEAIADAGYWFDVGRYWLKKNGGVVRFKNKIFNHRGSTDKFARKRKVRFAFSGRDASYVKSRYFRIEDAFSYSKKVVLSNAIDSCIYERYSFPEVESVKVADDSFAREALRSKSIKVSLFEEIATEGV